MKDRSVTQRPLVRTLLIAALAVLVTAPTGSSAQAASGTTAIDLSGEGFKRLKRQGVTVAARRPAQLSRGGVLRLPVTRGLVGSSAFLNHSGELRLRRGRHTLRLSRFQTRLQTQGSMVIASVGSGRYGVLSIAAPPRRLSLNASVGSASLRGARVSFTRRGARALKRRLRLERLPLGALGKLTVDALVGGSGGGGSGGGGGAGGGGAPPGGGGAPPQSGPLPDEPPLLARPPGAVNVASATITWHVRDSWIRYVTTERDVVALEGAIPGAPIEQVAHPCPDVPASAPPPPLVYSYTMPFTSGWYDAASGTVALYAAGGVRFAYPSHGIDLDVKNLEVELNGGASRVIARFVGRGATDVGDKRGVLAQLVPPTPGPGAAPSTLKLTIPSGGSESVFAGFYKPGDGFGCVTVSYSL